jgi:hypothetical protein
MKHFFKTLKEPIIFLCLFDISLDGTRKLNRYCIFWKARNFFNCSMCPFLKKEDEK